MPRRLRIESLGYHHVYNRGVAKGNVFEDDRDKAKFIEFLALVCKEYKFNIHSFCLMDNHYHLLIETKKENLSSGMRQLNAQYASYFNKRHERVGHLWQGRYKSWYVLEEHYLFTLFKYIETNPVKAKMTKAIGEYIYCSTYSMLKDAVPPFLQNSFVLREYDTKELFELLTMSLTEQELAQMEALHHTKYKHEEWQIQPLHVKALPSYFLYVKNKQERNDAMKKAHEEGYSKSEIAREVALSVAGVSKILKS